ncbi:MAG: hypothetical protein SGARI_001284 [Bacillariaceae sp.]
MTSTRAPFQSPSWPTICAEGDEVPPADQVVRLRHTAARQRRDDSIAVLFQRCMGLLRQKDALLNQQDETISRKETVIRIKDVIIQDKDAALRNKEAVIRNKEAALQDKDDEILTHP